MIIDLTKKDGFRARNIMLPRTPDAHYRII